MTIENDRSGTITTSGADFRNDPNGSAGDGDKTEIVKAESAEVADTAKQAGKEVMSEVSEQTTAVARTAKDQFGQLAAQTRQELKAQSEQRGEQLAARLQTWAGQMKALVEGRVDDAGDLRGLIGDAQHRLESYALSLRERGPDGVMQDVRGFARRRPGMFLLAAGATGFAIGRIVKAGGVSGPNHDGPSDQVLAERAGWQAP
jgi:gas vesicle protein